MVKSTMGTKLPRKLEQKTGKWLVEQMLPLFQDGAQIHASLIG